MFSALSQGSSIYLLDKTSTPKFSVGEVIGVSQPKLNYNFGQAQNTVDLKVKVDDTTQEFNAIPSINSIVTYNNGNLVISETKQGIQNEVESIYHNRKHILDHISEYEQDIESCESIMKQLNPQFAKDKELDDRLSNLETKFGGFESSLNEILNYVKK